jgi:catechol 2,3-dioxygenase-like lactoylglutathione lyase family enzyme
MMFMSDMPRRLPLSATFEPRADVTGDGPIISHSFGRLTLEPGGPDRRPDSERRTDMAEILPPHVTQILVVAIPVADQDRARDFYVDVLGFTLHEDVIVGEGFRWVELRLPGSPVGVALVVPEPDVPSGVDTGIRLAVDDARAMHAALVASGVVVGELLLWEGAPPMFVFCDVDGNRLYIVEAA